MPSNFDYGKGKVFVFKQKPTRFQAKHSGAKHFDTLIEFKTNKLVDGMDTTLSDIGIKGYYINSDIGGINVIDARIIKRW